MGPCSKRRRATNRFFYLLVRPQITVGLNTMLSLVSAVLRTLCDMYVVSLRIPGARSVQCRISRFSASQFFGRLAGGKSWFRPSLIGSSLLAYCGRVRICIPCLNIPNAPYPGESWGEFPAAPRFAFPCSDRHDLTYPGATRTYSQHEVGPPAKLQ
ncbi:hypothetical protein EDB89DRAFT_175423 [Lactarius sanguifluus]|nr:hypothetical protein EDB89DRAFT_175423 [Lactarius sanguifluus]